jgi:hypothetical protein
MTTNDKTLATGLGDRLGPVGRSFSYDNESARERLPLAVPFPRAFASQPFAPLRMKANSHWPPGAPHLSLLLFRRKRRKTCAAHSTHMDERNAMQMIENNQRHPAPLDTLVSVGCSVHLANVLIQSGAPETPEIPAILDMADMPDMADMRAYARHFLPICAIAALQRRGGFGLGQP